jgi:Domain of unknown function (DUF222)
MPASAPGSSVLEHGLRELFEPVVIDRIDVPLYLAAWRVRAGVPTGAVEVEYAGPSHAPRSDLLRGHVRRRVLGFLAEPPASPSGRAPSAGGASSTAAREARPPRLGELLSVTAMTEEQKARCLQQITAAEAELAAFKAEVVVGLAADRPASLDRRSGQAGAASGEWAAQLLDVNVSEFFPDELALILNCSRAAATREWEISSTLWRRLPATRAALAEGRLDKPRAVALATELGWPARETPDPVLAAVEAVVLPRATGVSIPRLRDLARAELIKADPAAADARRRQARAEADVTVRGLGDGMAELRSRMPRPDASAVRAEVDARARALKAAGDGRPIGQLRAAVLHDLVTRPWQERPAVSAHVQLTVGLDTLEAAAAGAPGAGLEPPTVDGHPVTPAQARELLERVDALCPGGLQPPTDGTVQFVLTGPNGELLASATRTELERAVRRGEDLRPPPSVDRYEPTPAQRRYVKTRDRTCRHPGCPNDVGWADLDHVIPHADDGETDCANLCCLCRRHHRLKTHARGWTHVMTPDGVLSVTTPSGVTRTSRPPGLHDWAGPAGPDPPPF